MEYVPEKISVQQRLETEKLDKNDRFSLAKSQEYNDSK